MLQRIGVSRSSGSAEGKRKQVSWQGMPWATRQVTCGWLYVGDLCDQETPDRQVCQIHPFFPLGFHSDPGHQYLFLAVGTVPFSADLTEI